MHNIFPIFAAIVTIFIHFHPNEWRFYVACIELFTLLSIFTYCSVALYFHVDEE